MVCPYIQSHYNDTIIICTLLKKKKKQIKQDFIVKDLFDTTEKQRFYDLIRNSSSKGEISKKKKKYVDMISLPSFFFSSSFY